MEGRGIGDSLIYRAWLPISDAIKIRTLVFRPEWTQTLYFCSNRSRSELNILPDSVDGTMLSFAS